MRARTADAGWCAWRTSTGRARSPGAAAGILRTLEAFGFEWDGEVVRQSDRREHYAAALESLRRAA